MVSFCVKCQCAAAIVYLANKFSFPIAVNKAILVLLKKLGNGDLTTINYNNRIAIDTIRIARNYPFFSGLVFSQHLVQQFNHLAFNIAAGKLS